MIKVLLAVGIGGFFGSIIRYSISSFIHTTWPLSFPYGTFIVNILGCSIIGILIAIFERNLLPSNLQFMLISGFCGGFTTFSAFSLETVSLFQNGQIFWALFYIVASIIICLSATAGGYFLLKT